MANLTAESLLSTSLLNGDGVAEVTAALDPGDDPALLSFHGEGVRTLATWDLLRRVVAIATAPGNAQHPLSGSK